MTPQRPQLLLALLLPLACALYSRADAAGAGDAVQPGTCLSSDEAELARLVQEYRKASGLPEIPLSKSLSLVAKWHAIDLEKNAPPEWKNERGEPCSLHSWSTEGPWKAFCYTSDDRAARWVWDKPNEMTDGKYRGIGTENVYYNSEEVLPYRVLDYWKALPEENAMLVETGSWTRTKWPAMGVGIYRHYAVLWLGTAKDPAGPIYPCNAKEQQARPAQPKASAAPAPSTR